MIEPNLERVSKNDFNTMFLTKIGSHKKRKLKKVMKKSLGEGVNLPHPNRNRVKDDKNTVDLLLFYKKHLK